MPGIITHNRILKETIGLLSNRQKKSYLANSIAALFSTPENLTAGLFGAIGPNIFDYLPRRDRQTYYGSDISFFIHNGGSYKLLQSMIGTVSSYEDKNTEWASAQRAYLYGFMSHIIADSIFHPFIFYYSGFPNSYTKKEIRFYREQNLLFKYHIDNFLQYHSERHECFTFNIEDMLPVKKKNGFYRLNPSIKALFLGSIKDIYPDIYDRLLVPLPGRLHMRHPNLPVSFDLAPYGLLLAYRLKRSANRRLAGFFSSLLRNNLFFSDFIVRYPMNRRYNKNILNLHREQWEHPAGKSGLHYESVYNLLAASCEKTLEAWESIEASLFGTKKINIPETIKNNAYTGDAHLSYHDMKTKRPIRVTY